MINKIKIAFEVFIGILKNDPYIIYLKVEKGDETFLNFFNKDMLVSDVQQIIESLTEITNEHLAVFEEIDNLVSKIENGESLDDDLEETL